MNLRRKRLKIWICLVLIFGSSLFYIKTLEFNDLKWRDLVLFSSGLKLGIINKLAMPRAKNHLLRGIASCMEESLDYSSLVPPKNDEVNRDKDDSSVHEVSQVVGSADFDFSKMNEWLPTQLAPTDKGSVVINKIADKGIQSFFSSQQFKNSQLGRINEKVKEQTKMEVNLSKGNKVEHKITANLEPFQQGARFAYQGYFGLNLSFYVPNKKQVFKVEEVFFNRKFYYENMLTLTDRQDNLGIEWNW